jgi:hypothetical protein
VTQSRSAWRKCAVLPMGALVVLFVGVRVRAADLPDLIFGNGFEPCVGLGCSQVVCPEPGQTTSVSGVVYAPNGTLPLPNVVVYVPNDTVEPLAAGAQCARCETPPSGSPLVLATSEADGTFTLGDMPATTNVPLVIQSGKWRRQVTIPAVPPCGDTPLDAETTRLPRSQGEGDIPLIALSTGGAEAWECLLRKTGLDDAEFTVAGGGGRVHLYAGTSGTDRFDPAHGGQTFTDSQTLWNVGANLAPYDMVLLSCEGGQNPVEKPLDAREAMKGYADLGGRVYASHWHNYWVQAGPSPWPTVATWSFLSDLGTITANVNQTFDRGADLAQWLVSVGATGTLGTLSIQETQHTVTAVDATLARKWIYKDTTANGVPTVQYFSFTTPAEAAPEEQCGRFVFSDIHVGGGDSSSTGLGFPSGGCLTPLTATLPHEKALIFMLFDLGVCVGSTRE